MKTTFAAPENNNPVKQAYETYVKRCIAAGVEPHNPEQWIQNNPHIVGIISAATSTDPDTYKVTWLPNEPTNEAREQEIREKFTQIMIDEGMVRDHSVTERARHYIQLGEERPMTVKQSLPCTLCGDILCRWAR